MVRSRQCRRIVILAATVALLLAGCGRKKAEKTDRSVRAMRAAGTDKAAPPAPPAGKQVAGTPQTKPETKPAKKSGRIDVKALAARLGKGYYPVEDFWAMYKPAMDSLRRCKGDPKEGTFTGECSAAAALALQMGQTPIIFKPRLDPAKTPAHFDRLAKDVGERLDTIVVGVQRVILMALFNKKLTEHPALRPGYRTALASPQSNVVRMAWHRLGGGRDAVPPELVRLARAAARDSINKPRAAADNWARAWSGSAESLLKSL